jgi:hypothetical protein
MSVPKERNESCRLSIVGSKIAFSVWIALAAWPFLGYCVEPQLRQLNGCNRIVPLEGVVDIADSGSGLLFVAVHDRRYQDAGGESLNTGRIVSVNRRTLEVKEIVLQGRDDYPFKPLGIDAISDQQDSYLFIVNEAFHSQRSIEQYRFQRGNLIFQKRIRTARMQGITDIALLTADEFVVARKHAWSFPFGQGDLILHRKSALHYLPLKTGGAQYLSRAGDRSVYIPSRKGLWKLDFDQLHLQRLALKSGTVPVAVVQADGRLYILQELNPPRLTMEGLSFGLPVKDPAAFAVLSPEKSIVFGSRTGGLTVCELPAL